MIHNTAINIGGSSPVIGIVTPTDAWTVTIPVESGEKYSHCILALRSGYVDLTSCLLAFATTEEADGTSSSWRSLGSYIEYAIPKKESEYKLRGVTIQRNTGFSSPFSFQFSEKSIDVEIVGGNYEFATNGSYFYIIW